MNGLNLRNTSIANVLNAPSITIPCHNPDEPPVGFMLIGKHGKDRELLSIARSIYCNERRHQGRIRIPAHEGTRVQHHDC